MDIICNHADKCTDVACRHRIAHLRFGDTCDPGLCTSCLDPNFLSDDIHVKCIPVKETPMLICDHLNWCEYKKGDCPHAIPHKKQTACTPPVYCMYNPDPKTHLVTCIPVTKKEEPMTRPVLHTATDRRCCHGAFSTDLAEEINDRQKLFNTIKTRHPKFSCTYFPAEAAYMSFLSHLALSWNMWPDKGSCLLEAWDLLINTEEER